MIEHLEAAQEKSATDLEITTSLFFSCFLVTFTFTCVQDTFSDAFSKKKKHLDSVYLCTQFTLSSSTFPIRKPPFFVFSLEGILALRVGNQRRNPLFQPLQPIGERQVQVWCFSLLFAMTV